MSELQTPIQRKIAAGMNPLIAFLSEATCGEACWQAREDVCRCSCGGKNHGCMRSADGIQPTRSAKIDGFRYELKAVGEDLLAEARAINSKIIRSVQGPYTYYWQETDIGAPARLKPATKAQIERWPELTAFRTAMQEAKARHEAPIVWLRRWPYLLWVKQ